jgi:uncharacterized membrane protein
MLSLVLRWLLALAMISVGILHFVDPEPFARIVPPYLPRPMALVYISGVFEILGGVGLVVPIAITQQIAAYGLVALFVAVFPANIYMAMERIPLGAKHLPEWALWARLPLQAVLIAWAWFLAKHP